MKLKYINFASIIFILFITSISFTYYEIYKFNKQKDNFHNYDNAIHKLIITNMKIKYILQKKLTYLNFDNLNTQTKTFEDLLQTLQDNPLNKSLQVDKDLLYKNISYNFEKRKELSEDFKSSNSSMLNSIHYLFDLEKSLQKDEKIPLKSKIYINSILYSIMSITLKLDLEYSHIYKQIELLKKQHLNNKNVNHFINHSTFALSQANDLSSILKKLSKLPIQSEILSLQYNFKIIYDDKISMQTLVVQTIFALLFIAAILLFSAYRKIQKTFLDLSAFKYAVENSDNTVVMTDLDHRITYVNEVFIQSTGYTEKEVLGQDPRILQSGLMDHKFYENLNKTLYKEEKWNGEFINKRKDGSLYYEKASIVPLYINNEVTSYLAIKLDITEYVKQKKQLQQSAAVFEHTMDGIMITDAKGIMISVNLALLKMTGYSKEELIGQNPSILKSGQHNKQFYKDMWKIIIEKGSWKGKILNRTKDGLLTQTWLSISTVKDDKGNVLNYIAIHTDLNELILIQEKVDFIAHHDSLTKLPNRRYLEETLEQIISLSKREESNFSILFIDLDRFKLINDTLGHDIGDELLKVVSIRIKNLLRKSDTLARMGGDEFIIVSPNIKSKDEPAHISTKILQSLEKTIDIKGYTLNITASIGISIFPEDGETSANLIKHADSAMYHAKDLGKNTYQYFTEKLSIDTHQRLNLEQALRKAIKNKELYLNYQPQYDLKTREIIGAEALVRWNSPELGFIGPDKFIPIAEETKMILELGELIFEEACKAFIIWKKNCINIHTIAINVSSIQLAEANIVKTFKEIIQRVGIDASNVEIELTERYLFKHKSSGETVLNELRNLGFKISIDDFGTGYSSMSYLKQLPLDTIKIDKSFIDDIPHDSNDIEITRAIMALSSSLGYINIAEGIETKEQEDFLRNEGCQIGQGYYFQRPISSEAFMEFCQSQSYRLS